MIARGTIAKLPAQNVADSCSLRPVRGILKPILVPLLGVRITTHVLSV